MTPGPSAPPEKGSRTRAALARGAGLFALWLVLVVEPRAGDLVVGAFAATAATWASLRLLPPESGRVRFLALVGLLPRFLWQSVVAGVDVARRAFAPRVRIDPGFVSCPTGFPRGAARNAFASVTSLLPGSVPSGEEESAIVLHCIDVAQPVAEQIAAEERRYAKAFGAGRGDA